MKARSTSSNTPASAICTFAPSVSSAGVPITRISPDMSPTASPTANPA
nr:hypothetical protein [Synergistes jonesii]